MFEIIFYNMKSEKNKIGKTKEELFTLQGVLREETSIINPSITIETDIVPIANYIYIPIFNRYYFITDITSIRNKLWKIECHVDVLDSYEAQIKSLNGIISRQENLYNLYLKDDKLQVKSDTFTLDNRIGNASFQRMGGAYDNILITSSFVQGG